MHRHLLPPAPSKDDPSGIGAAVEPLRSEGLTLMTNQPRPPRAPRRSFLVQRQWAATQEAYTFGYSQVYYTCSLPFSPMAAGAAGGHSGARVGAADGGGGGGGGWPVEWERAWGDVLEVSWCLGERRGVRRLWGGAGGRRTQASPPRNERRRHRWYAPATTDRSPTPSPHHSPDP